MLLLPPGAAWSRAGAAARVRVASATGTIRSVESVSKANLRSSSFSSSHAPSRQVEELQVQLETEASRRSQLERANGELKEQLASLSSLGHSSEQLERNRRQLEEELLELRRRLEAEHSQAEQFRHNVEERARQEVQQKLEQVNLFLQVRHRGSGAAS